MSLVFYKPNHNDDGLTGVAATVASVSDQASTSPVKCKTASQFYTGDYAHFGDILNFEADDPFTVAFWIKLEASPGDFTVYTGKRQSTGKGWAIVSGGSGSRNELGVQIRSSAGTEIIRRFTGVTTDTWVHFVLSYDGSRDVSGVKCWHDTVEVTNVSGDVNNLPSQSITHSDNFGIRYQGNAAQTATDHDFELSGLRVYDHALSQAEVDEIYNPKVYVPDGILFRLDDHLDATDSAGGASITYTGSPTTQTGPFNLTKSAGRYGSGQYASAGNVTDLNFGANKPMSVAFWMYRSGTPNQYGVYVGKGDADTHWLVASGPSSDRGALQISLQSSSSNRIIVKQPNVNNSEWIHVAFTYDGTDAQGIGMYMNGQSVKDDLEIVENTLGDNSFSNSSGFGICLRDDAEETLGIDLDIADVLVTDSEMTAQQVAAIYEEAAPSDDWRIVESVVDTYESGGNDWFGRAASVTLTDGSEIMLYRGSVGHSSSNDSQTNIRFRPSHNSEWGRDNRWLDDSPITTFPLEDISGFEPGDSMIHQMQNGDLLVWQSYVDATRDGFRQYRSTDKGKTWTNEGKVTIDSQDDGLVCGGQFADLNGATYAVIWYDAGADLVTPTVTWLVKSTDNGANWTKVADLFNGEDVNEAGLIAVGNQLYCVGRATSNSSTLAQFITNDTPETHTDIHSAVGNVQRPILTSVEGNIVLTGRQGWYAASQFTCIYISPDNGTTWRGPFRLDPYDVTDGGYTATSVNGRSVEVVSYRGDTNAAGLTRSVLHYKGAAIASSSGTATPTLSGEQIA